MSTSEEDEPIHPVAREGNGRFAAQGFAAIYDALNREVKRIDDSLEREIKRIEGLRTADQVSLVAALTAAKTAVDAALAAAEKAVAAALIAAKEAVNKAELAQQRTNEGQNEFRGQLKDQAATLLPRTEYILAHRALEEKVEGALTEINTLRSRVDIGPPGMKSLQTQSDTDTGRRAGSLDMRTLVLGLLAAAGTILGIISFMRTP